MTRQYLYMVETRRPDARGMQYHHWSTHYDETDLACYSLREAREWAAQLRRDDGDQYVQARVVRYVREGK